MSESLDRWQFLDQVFSEALDLEPDRRVEYVRTRCQGDPDAEARVLALLESASDEEFLDRSQDEDTIEAVLSDTTGAPDDDPSPGADPLVGQKLGPYRLVRAIGYGGMGTVYLGEREEPFVKRVAVKTLRRGIDTDEVVQRFLAERQILAELDHPNIARLLDGGVTRDGRPYFVMDYVHGVQVTDYADEAHLGIRERLGLLTEIAAALQHAHQHLVIHRDLKPSNVLVTPDGLVKLLDFGIARLVGSDRREGSLRTATSVRVFTPEYAAPEQVARGTVTTGTDVYQLGALAYELLSGVRVYPEHLKGLALERQILEEDPAPLHKAVARAGPEAAVARALSSREALAQALAGDLAVIVGKALHKEPSERYPSVQAFAADVERFLDGRPVEARPATLTYRFGRFTRRNRWFVPVAAASLFALAFYTVSSVRHARALTAERNIAQSEAERAEAVTAFLTDLFESPDPWAGGAGADVTVLEALEDGAARIETEFADQPALQARLFQRLGASYYGLERLDLAEPIQRKALELWRELAGPESLDTQRATSEYARTVASMLGADSAQALLEPALGHLSSATDDARLELRAQVLNTLARVQWDISSFDSAFVLYESARESIRALEVPRPELEAAVLRDHSRASGVADRLPEQRQLIRAAVELLEDALPPDHIELAAARWDLGSSLSVRGMGRGEEALRQLDLARAVFEERLGPKNPNVLDLQFDRAYALFTMERFEEAEREYRRLLPLYRSQSGVAHRRTANRYTAADVMQNLAASLNRLRRLDEAIEYSLQAHEFYEEELGTHYLTAYPLLTAAGVELERGNARAGGDLAAEAYDILLESLPEGHASTWVARCRRGRGWWGSGQKVRGLEDLVLASAALTERHPPDHPHRMECTAALAAAQAAGG